MSKIFSKYRLVYSHLWHTYGASWQIRVSFILQVVSRICKLIALPVAMSIIIAKLSVSDFAGAYQGVLFFASTSLILGIITPLSKYVGMLGENKVYANDTSNYFSRLINADLDYFNSNLSGYLTAATRQYVDSGLQLVRSLRDRYLGTILSIVFPLVVIIFVDPWLGVVAFGLSLVQAAYLIWSSRAIDPLRHESREVYKKLSGKIADAISNVLAVRSNAQEQSYSQKIKKGAQAEAIIFTRRSILQAKLVSVREFISVVFFIILLWLTVTRMSGGFIDITAAVLVVTYTMTILTGIYSLSDDIDQHDDFVDKIIPAFDILNRKNTITDPTKPKKFANVKGDINLKNITFAYDKGQPVFKDFSLKIPAGQKIGVVGLSGAGKSTLTKLLLRFNDVSTGRVLIDNIDIREVAQTELRKNIAYVPQEPLLFHASIKQNVLLGRPEASDNQVKQALESSHAMHFINQLSEGVNSVVGERGVKLSGGQKQRIAIARAVLRHSPIIILDEATSALDSESEQIIKDSFAEILKGKTALVIAHRLSTLSNMDRIVVIEDGKCIEDGTHKSLLAKGGAYAKLWKRQLKHLED